MPDWSEGSVLVLLGMTSQDKDLMLQGFKLIHEDGHKLAPDLISTLHRSFKAAKVMGSHETESEEQILKCMASCINDLENKVEDSKIVEAFLADIAKDYH